MPHLQKGVAPPPILVIRHESDLSEYDRVTYIDGRLTQGASSALAGTRGGLAIQMGGTQPTYGQAHFAPLIASSYRFRLYFDPNGFKLDDQSVQNIVSLHDTQESQKAWITLRRQHDHYRIRVNVRDDQYTLHQSAWFEIGDDEHLIEVQVQYASSPTASDGQISLWIDGNQRDPISSLDLYDLDTPAFVRLGSNWASQGSTSGTYYLDEFVLRDDGLEIGPVPAPTPTPTLTCTPDPTAGKEIRIDHESDLGEYDSLVDDGSDLDQSHNAALAGTQGGMRLLIDDDTGIYGTKTLGIHEGPAYRFRHYLDPNGLSMPNTSQITLAQVRGKRDLVVTRLQYTLAQGYTLYVRYVDDQGAWRSLPGTPISDAAHSIEVRVEFASGPSARDGSITYWVDDVQAGQHGGLDLYDKYRRPDSVRLGAPWLSSAEIRGTLYVDEFALRGSSEYIGPVNPQPSLVTPAPTTGPVTATPTPGPAPNRGEPQTIAILPDQVRGPSIRETSGGNFHHGAQGVTDAVDPVGALNLEVLNPRHVRVNMALDDWEPVNDNDDDQSFKWSAFHESAFHTAALALMQERAQQDATFVASVWDVPDWAVDNPDDTYRRRIKPDMYPEVAESIVAWLLYAEREYGITIDYVSINEPDIGVFIWMPAQDQPPLILETGERLAEHDLPARWLLADVSILRACQDYAATVWSYPQVRPFIGPLACHSYDQRFASDQILQDLSQFAQTLERELWVTEAQWRAHLDPDLYSTWDNALELSVAYSRLLKEGRASTLFYWQMLKNGFSNNDGTASYPALDMLAQFKHEIPAGSRVVATLPNTESLYSLAVSAPSHFALFVIHTGSQRQVVRLLDLPPGTYHHVISGARGTLQQAGKVDVTGDLVQLTLEPKSVNLFTTRPRPAD